MHEHSNNICNFKRMMQIILLEALHQIITFSAVLEHLYYAGLAFGPYQIMHTARYAEFAQDCV